MVNEDEVVEDFLEGQPRAAVWRELRESLAGRLRDAVAERDALAKDDPARRAADKRVADLENQVAALAQEEAITQFVEDSVRASLNRPRRPGQVFDDEDEY